MTEWGIKIIVLILLILSHGVTCITVNVMTFLWDSDHTDQFRPKRRSTSPPNLPTRIVQFFSSRMHDLIGNDIIAGM